jgi:hypothetical protein
LLPLLLLLVNAARSRSFTEFKTPPAADTDASGSAVTSAAAAAAAAAADADCGYLKTGAVDGEGGIAVGVEPEGID